jgi:hypothetical protein
MVKEKEYRGRHEGCVERVLSIHLGQSGHEQEKGRGGWGKGGGRGRKGGGSNRFGSFWKAVVEKRLFRGTKNSMLASVLKRKERVKKRLLARIDEKFVGNLCGSFANQCDRPSTASNENQEK